MIYICVQYVLKSSHTVAVTVKFFCIGGGGKIVSGLLIFNATATTTATAAAMCGYLYVHKSRHSNPK